MDKQFIFFMFQAAYCLLANIIDDGFANRMSIDAVVAYGSFLVIIWTGQCIYNIGKYAYTNMGEYAKSCLYLSIVFSIISTIIMYSLSDKIPLIYDISIIQRNMMSDLIKAHSLCLVFRSIGDFMELYNMYHSKNKRIFIADITYWIIAISLDFIVFKINLGVHWLMYTTGFAYLIGDIIYLYKSEIFKDKFNFYGFKKAFIKGKDICIDRLSGKIATIVYGIFASKLPERLYAIHCVCYGIITNTEYFTNNFNVYIVGKLTCIKNKYVECKKLIRLYFIPLVLIEYIFSIFLLFLYHGKVSYYSCIIWLFIYLTDCISLYFYEAYKAILSSYSKTEYLKFGGIIGIFTRIPIVIISYYLNIGLIGFALACTIDFGMRALYFYNIIKKVESKNYLQNVSSYI